MTHASVTSSDRSDLTTGATDLQRHGRSDGLQGSPIFGGCLYPIPAPRGRVYGQTPQIVHIGHEVGSVRAEGYRPDVAKDYPGCGPLHGFSLVVSVSHGEHEISVIAVNVGSDRESPLGSKTARYPVEPPDGVIESGGRFVEDQRVLASVLFADIVDSASTQEALGDRRWRDLAEAFFGAARASAAQFGGRLVKTQGDGTVSIFPDPDGAIRSAVRLQQMARDLGLDIRQGLNVGQVDLYGDDISGQAVTIGARIAALSDPGEILVSGALRDIVRGSDLMFVDRGARRLKGITGEMRVYSLQR